MADYNFINGVGGGQAPPDWVASLQNEGLMDRTSAPPQKQNFLQKLTGAYQRAGQISQERRVPNNDLNREAALQHLEATRWAMKEKAYSMALKIQERQAMTEIGEALTTGAFDDPKTMSKVLGIAARYGLDTEATEPIMRRFEQAQTYKQRMELLNRELEGRLEIVKAEQAAMTERSQAAIQSRMQLAEMRTREAEIKWQNHKNLAVFKAEVATLKDQFLDQAEMAKAIDELERKYFGGSQAAPAEPTKPAVRRYNPVTDRFE